MRKMKTAWQKMVVSNLSMTGPGRQARAASGCLRKVLQDVRILLQTSWNVNLSRFQELINTLPGPDGSSRCPRVKVTKEK